MDSALVTRFQTLLGIIGIVMLGLYFWPPVLGVVIIICACEEYLCVLLQLWKQFNQHTDVTCYHIQPTFKIFFHLFSQIIFLSAYFGLHAMTTVCSLFSFVLLLANMVQVANIQHADGYINLPIAIRVRPLVQSDHIKQVVINNSHDAFTKLEGEMSISTHYLRVFFIALFQVIGLWYVGWLLGHAYLIYQGDDTDLPNIPVESKNWIRLMRLTYVIVVNGAGENGAIFFGRVLKLAKTPMATFLSPKKTMEGLLGQLLSEIAFSFIFQSIVDTHLSQISLFLLPIWITLTGVFGDLFESFYKRCCHIKDAGTILPGVGGVLDRIDGLLFAFPGFYFVQYYFKL